MKIMSRSNLINPWALPLTQLENDLETNLKQGLTSEKIPSLKESFGRNVLSEEKRTGRLKIFLRQFHSPMIYTLLFATVIALYLGENPDALAILLIVILNAFIGFAQEAKAEDAILALKKLTVPKAKVFREGEVKVIDSSEVLPGDLLQLEAGDYVVADARLIKAYQMSCDEGILTGESLPVQKIADALPACTDLSERVNMVFAGTAISSGSGQAIVTSIGMNTEIGHIAGLLKDTGFIKSPLQIRLDKVSNNLLKVGGLIMLIVAVLGVIKGDEWSVILMSAIGLSVAAIPEGLPTVVTLALTLAVRRMTKRNALVRKMNAVETLGSTDIICTDKTGTLTTGKMQVREVHALQDEEIFLRSLILCNNASINEGGVSGDTTEIALLIYAEERGLSVPDCRNQYNRIHEWSFDSDRKRMSVAIRENEEILIYCKGAPESILPLCDMSPEMKKKIEEQMDALSRKGRRILAFASKKESERDFTQVTESEIERDLTFIGLTAMADPPKEDAIDSIRSCKEAGIKVVMITGDHPVTAHAIAKELGIPDEGTFDQILTGPELNSLSNENLVKAVERTAVYARVSPEHKLIIIEALQSNGHIVSMTGDGVNDAPALKKASIGVSMGKGGTEVARQASAIILTDDNFATIVSAVEEGRAIFGNIKRTIQYLLSSNLGELLIMLFAAVLMLPTPLTPIGLLWINLVTDGLPSLALAAEPVEKDFLKTSGGPSPASFFDKSFLWEVGLVGLLMMIIQCSVYVYALKSEDILTAKTYAFNVMVYLSLFRSFSCRSETKTYFELPFNKWHFFSVVIPIVLQLALQHSEFYNKLFRIRMMSFSENLTMLLFGMIPFIVVEIYKVLKRTGQVKAS